LHGPHSRKEGKHVCTLNVAQLPLVCQKKGGALVDYRKAKPMDRDAVPDLQRIAQEGRMMYFELGLRVWRKAEP
jgi:hypothetical protein